LERFLLLLLLLLFCPQAPRYWDGSASVKAAGSIGPAQRREAALTDAVRWIAARGLGAVSNDSRRLSVLLLFAASVAENALYPLALSVFFAFSYQVLVSELLKSFLFSRLSVRFFRKVSRFHPQSITAGKVKLLKTMEAGFRKVSHLHGRFPKGYPQPG
jgi:hypothetical protein